MEVRGQTRRGHARKGNREKYSMNAREEQKRQQSACGHPAAGPCAIRAPRGWHGRPPQLHRLYPPEGAPAQQRETRPCGNRQSSGQTAPPTPAAMEEELWRVRGTPQCRLQWVGGLVATGAATNAPSPTQQASHLATCSWRSASSFPCLVSLPLGGGHRYGSQDSSSPLSPSS